METKTAASAAIGALITLIFGLAATYHWFAPPPPYLTALTITAATALAGWLAPHTPRETTPAPLIQLGPPAENWREAIGASFVQPASGQAESPAAAQEQGRLTA